MNDKCLTDFGCSIWLITTVFTRCSFTWQPKTWKVLFNLRCKDYEKLHNLLHHYSCFPNIFCIWTLSFQSYSQFHIDNNWPSQRGLLHPNSQIKYTHEKQLQKCNPSFSRYTRMVQKVHTVSSGDYQNTEIITWTPVSFWFQHWIASQNEIKYA